MQALLTYWQDEDAILDDLLANLNILKKDWGQWQPDGDKVLFKDNASLPNTRPTSPSSTPTSRSKKSPRPRS